MMWACLTRLRITCFHFTWEIIYKSLRSLFSHPRCLFSPISRSTGWIRGVWCSQIVFEVPTSQLLGNNTPLTESKLVPYFICQLCSCTADEFDINLIFIPSINNWKGLTGGRGSQYMRRGIWMVNLINRKCWREATLALSAVNPSRLGWRACAHTHIHTPVHSVFTDGQMQGQIQMGEHLHLGEEDRRAECL